MTKSILLNKNYTENNISEIISKTNFIFKYINKNLNGYDFKVSIDQDKLTSITALVIYKVLAFAIDNSCLKNPSANIDNITKLFTKFHLHDLIKAYYNQKDIDRIFSKIQPVRKSDFFVAPHPINRESIIDKNELQKKYYKTIHNYYSGINFEIIDYIKTCLVEISSNFLYHAENDEKSILMAEGNNQNVEIVSVDTSNGIISTMEKKYKGNKDSLLKKAFERKVSSKIENGHCGTGLYLVNEIVNNLNGKLVLYTEGYLYRNIQGRIFVSKTAYWKGTIIYVKLPIKSVIDINDFFNNLTNTKKYV